MGWIPRPGLDLAALEFFARNLFYSTSVAAALIVLAVPAWAVAWREAAGRHRRYLPRLRGRRPDGREPCQTGRGIISQGKAQWLMIGYGMECYLGQDLGPRVAVIRYVPGPTVFLLVAKAAR
jgi:hypothetical protein